MMTFDATELPKLDIESLYDMWITPSGRLYAGGWVGLFVFDEGAWRACAVRGRNVVKSLTGHEETVWALLARGSVVRTEDGERWKSAKAMRKNNSSSVITTDGVHLVGHDSTFSQITTSDDGGESFTTHARDGYSMSSPRVSGVPSGFVVRGKQFEGIGLSTDHGRTWVSTTYEASIYFRTVHATDTHAFVIDGETVQRWTHDLSEAKTVLTLDREAAAMDSTASGRVVIAGHRGLLVVSEDHGETWEYVDVGSGIDLTGIRLHGDEILVHDGSGRILRGTLSEASSEASTEDVVAGTVEVLHEAFEDFEEHDISASWPRPDQHPYAPNALTFVGDERLVSSDPSGRLLMWSVRDGQWGFESMLVPAGNERAQHLASSGDSVWLVGDDGVRVVDVTSGGVETVCDLSESHHTQIRYDGLLVVDGRPLAHANRSLITFSERERTHHALEAAVSGQLDPQIQYVEHDALLDELVVSTTTGAVQYHSPTTFEPTGGFSARSGLAFTLEDTARVGVARMGTPNWSTS